MKHAQQAALDMNDAWHWNPESRPKVITWETNGTQELTDDFRNALMNKGVWNIPTFFSSPTPIFLSYTSRCSHNLE